MCGNGEEVEKLGDFWWILGGGWSVLECGCGGK